MVIMNSTPFSMENYLKVYAVAEKTWNSEDSTANQKAEAFRQQRALILASTNDPEKQKSLLLKLYQKLEQKLGIGNQQSEETSLKRLASPTRSRQDDGPRINSAESIQDFNAAFSKHFRTSRELLSAQQIQKGGNAFSRFTNNASKNAAATAAAANKNSKQCSVLAKFQPPVQEVEQSNYVTCKRSISKLTPSPENDAALQTDERLANIEPKMIELITNEIMHKCTRVEWSDIAGLTYAKSIIQEAVVFPLLRPDIFTGLRRPPRGILLFGPPGTGKTLIGKCIASQSGGTFFSISASALTSKWVGDGEKMVRALFAVAAVHSPAVIFIDEIDSLLCKRSESEHESTRRLKTEFLVHLDGAATSNDDRILVVAATNRPQELDEAARRRFVRRLYVPLPEEEARIQILRQLVTSVRHDLSAEQLQDLGRLSDGYSGADMDSLCCEAAMGPVRAIPMDQMRDFPAEQVRPVNVDDFRLALRRVRPSVSQGDLSQYVEWNSLYGAGP